MKKKILFIALHFPPSEGIADIRAANLAKQLSKNNFDVTLLTINKDYFKKTNKEIPEDIKNIDTIRVNYFMRLDAGNIIGNKKIPKIIRKIFLKLLPFFGLDYLFFWQRNAIKSVLKSNKEFDYILATGPPFSNFLLAKRLSHRLGCEFIIDYRDPWSLTAHGTASSNNFFNRRLEQTVLSKTSLVVFNSPSMQEIMLRNFQFNKSIVLTNGYDLKDFQDIPTHKYNKFIISYVGNFYIPKRVIDPIFKSLKRIKEKNRKVYENINFIYCGRAAEYIKLKSIEYEIDEIVINKGLVTRNEAFSITKSSNLSVIISTVFIESSKSEKSIIPGKIFEAIAMDIDILCISPKQSDVRNIVSSNPGGFVANGTEIDKIVNYILESYKQRNNNKKYRSTEFQWDYLIKELIKELI